jgi:hypothetical protein
MMMSDRRFFLKTAALGAVLPMIPEILSAASEKGSPKKVSVHKGDTILFQGDSITDFHRKRSDNDRNSPEAMGIGYAAHACTSLLFRYPELNLSIYNRGVSGNKVYQLRDRWDKDTLSLSPRC